MEELTEKGLGKSLEARFTTNKAVNIPDAISQSQALSSFGVDRIIPRQVATGTYRGQQGIGSQNIVNDAEGNRIFIKDDTNIRVVLGKVR